MTERNVTVTGRLCEWCAAAPAVLRFCSEPCYRLWSRGKHQNHPERARKLVPVAIPGELVPCWRELMAVHATWQAKRPSARSQGAT